MDSKDQASQATGYFSIWKEKASYKKAFEYLLRDLKTETLDVHTPIYGIPESANQQGHDPVWVYCESTVYVL